MPLKKKRLLIKDKEGESILKNIKDNMFVIALELKGEYGILRGVIKLYKGFRNKRRE